MGSLTAGFHGAPGALALLVAVVAGLCHHHHWVPRLTSWLFGIAAMLATVSATVWLDTLAGLTSSGKGITILVALVIVFGALAYRHMDKRKHHPVWSSAIFVVAGVLVVVVIGSFRLITKNAAHSLKGSGSALGQAITQVNSGHAAHAVPSGNRVGILLWAAAIFTGLVAFAKIRHGKSGGSRKAVTSGPPRAITSGPPPAPAGAAAGAQPAKRK